MVPPALIRRFLMSSSVPHTLYLSMAATGTKAKGIKVVCAKPVTSQELNQRKLGAESKVIRLVMSIDGGQGSMLIMNNISKGPMGLKSCKGIWRES